VEGLEINGVTLVKSHEVSEMYVRPDYRDDILRR